MELELIVNVNATIHTKARCRPEELAVVMREQARIAGQMISDRIVEATGTVLSDPLKMQKMMIDGAAETMGRNMEAMGRLAMAIYTPWLVFSRPSKPALE